MILRNSQANWGLIPAYVWNMESLFPAEILNRFLSGKLLQDTMQACIDIIYVSCILTIHPSKVRWQASQNQIIVNLKSPSVISVEDVTQVVMSCFGARAKQNCKKHARLKLTLSGVWIKVEPKITHWWVTFSYKVCDDLPT